MDSTLFEVFVSIGSNIEPRFHIKRCIKEIEINFGETRLSNCYESKAVGFDGDNFLNLVVSFSTNKSVVETNGILHLIEDHEGRQRTDSKVWDSRTLDLDILLYGDECGIIDGVEIPRPEVLDQAHVLIPLVELAGNKVHPKKKETYAEILFNQKFSPENIWKVSLY